MSPRTLPGLLEARRRASPGVHAFFTLNPDRSWQAVSWEQFARGAAQIGAALIEAGIGKGDRIGILAPTSLNWEYAQMGAFIAAATVAGIDPNYPADQLAQVLRVLDPPVLFVQNHAMLAKVPVDLRNRIKLIMIFDGNALSASERSVQDILIAGHDVEPEKISGHLEPQDAAVMVFSSGTTGSPKAIVFSHEQVLAAIDAILEAFDDIEPESTLLCWLPLANLFQRIINFCAIGRGFSSYILSDPRDLTEYVASVKPSILIGVPRVFERMQEKIVEHIEKLPWPSRDLVLWSLRLGREYAGAKLSGRRPGITIVICWYFTDKLILRRLRAIFGTRLRYFVSGSAPMPLRLLEWYEAIGLPVLEAYGISENIIPVAINRIWLRKIGTVGKPLSPNRVAFAPDGEILINGPGIFNGYWNAPQHSAERLDINGYWQTGDLGYMDEEGFLFVTGRKSEIFKTSGGKWLSPVRVEERLHQVDYIEQAIVFSLDSGTIATILNIDKVKFMRRSGCCLQEKSVSEKQLNEACADSLRADLEAALEDLPIYYRPAGVIITLELFSIEGGELTTNLKLRRKIIIDRFASHLKRLEIAISETLKSNRYAGGRSVLTPVILLI